MNTTLPRRIVTVLCLILLVGYALTGVLKHTFMRDSVTGFVEGIPGFIRFLAWLLAFGGPIWLLVDYVRSQTTKKPLELEGKSGEKILLRQGAVVKIVRESVAELPEIAKVRVHAKSARNGLSVYLNVRAKAVGTVRELEARIHNRVDECLRKTLGLDKIDSIYIAIDDLGSRDRVTPDASPAADMPPPKAALNAAPGSSTTGTHNPQ